MVPPTTPAPATTPGITALNRTASQDTITLDVPKTPETPEVKEDKKIEDTTKLVSDTTGGSDTKTVKTVKKPAGSSWGTKTQDAIKKAQSDFNKTVKSVFGGKSESTKPESTTTPAGTDTTTTGGGTTDGTDSNKSDSTDK